MPNGKYQHKYICVLFSLLVRRLAADVYSLQLYADEWMKWRKHLLCTNILSSWEPKLSPLLFPSCEHTQHFQLPHEYFYYDKSIMPKRQKATPRKVLYQWKQIRKRKRTSSENNINPHTYIYMCVSTRHGQTCRRNIFKRSSKLSAFIRFGYAKEANLAAIVEWFRIVGVNRAKEKESAVPFPSRTLTDPHTPPHTHSLVFCS